jgi:O-antigen ligase
MNAETWDNRCNQGILGLFLAILVFSALAFGGVGSWEFLGIQALAMGVLVLWAVRVWASPKPRFLWPPITWCALAFAAYAIGRYLTCDIEYAGRWELLQVMVFTLLFLAVVNNLFHQETAQIISYTLIILAMANSSYALVQYITHSDRVWLVVSENPGRASGTFMSPDHFCGYLEMILPLVLSLLLAGRIKPLTRVLLGYCFLVILGSVAVTFSRAGWLATTTGLVLVLLVLIGHQNHRKAAGLVLLLLTGGGIVFVTCFLSKTVVYLARVADAQGKVNLDVFVREKIWHDAWRMWQDHFWWGVGPGHFDWLYDEYRSAAVQMRPGWPHCDYLNVLTDWGLAGGLIVAVAMAAGLWGLGRTWPRVRRAEKDIGSGMSNRFAIFLGAVGGLAAIAVHSLVDFSLHVPADDLVALTLLGLLSSNLRFATERYWHKARLPSKLVATVVLLTATGYFGWQTFRLGHEAWWLAQAAKLPDSTLDQAKVREKAFHYEPMNFENAYNIGEGYRNAGLEDSVNEAEWLDTARGWYQRSEKLNPYYSLSFIREGQYLDLLGQTNAAWRCFDHADLVDPNGYFTAANVGFHFLQTGELAAARMWLIRSLVLKPANNPVATASTALVEQGLSDEAGNLP